MRVNLKGQMVNNELEILVELSSTLSNILRGLLCRKKCGL